jgi:multiple sugar transport system substrate-binding protein
MKKENDEGTNKSPLSRRRFLQLGGAGVAATAIAACSGSDGDTTTTAGAVATTAAGGTDTTAAGDTTTTAGAVATTAAGEAKTVRVLVVGDPFQFAMEKILDQFTAKTGINVEFESLGYDALQQRLVSAFVAKSADADVIAVDQMWTGQYLDNGWVQPLDDFIKADSDFDINAFIPEVVHSQSAWRGQLGTLPLAAYGQGVIYRRDVFDSLGLDAPPADPTASWTWDKYLETVQAINGQNVGGTDMYGTVIVGQQPVPIVHMFTQLAASHGARWFAQFPEAPWDFTPAVDSAQNIAAANMYKQLFDLAAPESINYNWFDAGTRFSEGDIGMFYWWSAYFYLVKNSGYMSGEPSPIKDLYEIAALPQADGVDPVNSIGGWSLGMPSTAGDPDAAWEFIKWATGAEAQKAMGMLPDYGFQYSDFPLESLYEDGDLLEIYPYLPTQKKLLSQGNGKLVRPPMPIYASLESVYGLQLNKILGGGDPKATLEEATSLFTNVLSGNFMLPYSGESFDDTLASTKALMAELS